MSDIMTKERSNIVTDITKLSTVINNSMKHAAVMYAIREQYRTCNRNYEHYVTTIMT